MTSDLRASIDIGSNSVLLLVADLSHGKFKVISKKSEITALGRELDKTKMFHPESMSATYDAIKSFAQECGSLGISPQNIIATATEASRVATNSEDFFNQIEKDTGVKILTITSAAEAYFSTRGILFDTSFENEIITIMDIGGASTELIRVNTKSFQILSSISMPIGAVRSSQWLADDLFVQNLQKIFVDFRLEIDKFQGKELFCVAGTVTSLGNMHLNRRNFDEEEVHGLSLKSEDIDALFKKFSNFTPDQFLEYFPFLQKRSLSIRGGLHLVYHLIHRLLVKELTISTYGLRYGTLLEGKIKEEFLHGKSDIHA
jgi:exopolyphosphatase/guanosine-5'-triphosphate,3'-diphosphate pyrophosphatase